MNCNACSRQFFCKLVNNYSDTNQCKDFKSYLEVKDYGKPIRTNDIKKRKE